jgi:uridine kinase
VIRLNPAPIVVVEGILVLAVKRVRQTLDARIFVSTDDDIRFIRRLQRDVTERGRRLESVIEQYTGTVRPMHHAFVEPSKRHADVIIPRGGKNEVAIRMVIADMRARVARTRIDGFDDGVELGESYSGPEEE